MLPTPPPSKILKPERTLEENQERAYIAASRRSDRSLKARVESARRAYKSRTGRSLRITEQDVVNEEMYEEEDDDQHGRLDARRKAICKTGSTYTSPKFTKTDVSLLVFCSFLLAKQDEIQMLEDCSDQIDVRYNFFNKCALLEDLETKILDDGSLLTYRRDINARKKPSIDRLRSVNSIPAPLVAEELAYMEDLHDLVPVQENAGPGIENWADRTNLFHRVLGRWFPASYSKEYRNNESLWRRSSKSNRWLSGLCLKTLCLTGLLPSVLASESTDALSSLSSPVPQEIILPSINKLGWPFEPGWPPFDGWPFVLFGVLLAAATFISAMFKKTNTALVSGIGMAVSAFLGFTILNDKTTTPTVTWTMVVIELFYASFYAVVHWRKYNMAEGCQLTVLALTFMIALILITTFSDSKGQGISKEIVACFVPPSFSISLFLCCSWSALFGPAYIVPYHGKIEKVQGVPVTSGCQHHAVCGCDEESRLADERQLTSGATEASTPQQQEQGRVSQPAGSDINTNDGGFVDTPTQGGTPQAVYSPRPPVKNQQSSRARKDGLRL